MYTPCTKLASYNYFNDKRRLYCNEHKLDSMINLASVYCNYTSCQIRANYGFLGEKA